MDDLPAGLEIMVLGMGCSQCNGLDAVRDIVGRVWIYVVLGIAVGAGHPHCGLRVQPVALGEQRA